MGLVAHGSKAMTWHEVDTSGKLSIKGVSAILLSWILSPVLSGIVAAAFFWIARTFVLRHDEAYDRVFWCLPGLVCICAFINALYVLDRGIDQQCASAPVALFSFICAGAQHAARWHMCAPKNQFHLRHCVDFLQVGIYRGSNAPQCKSRSDCCSCAQFFQHLLGHDSKKEASAES